MPTYTQEAPNVADKTQQTLANGVATYRYRIIKLMCFEVAFKQGQDSHLTIN